MLFCNIFVQTFGDVDVYNDEMSPIVGLIDSDGALLDDAASYVG